MDQNRMPAVTQVVYPAIRDWLDEWPRFIIATLLWLLGLITIVFGPPATFGLFYMTQKTAYGDVIQPRKVWEGAKKYFWKSWLWFLLNIAVLAIMAGNIFFYDRFKTIWGLVLQVTLFFLALVWLAVQFYTIPFFMELNEKSLKRAMRNSAVVVFNSPGFTFFVLVTFLLLAILGVIFIFPIFLGFPCLLALIGSRAVRQRIEDFNDGEA